MAEKSTGDIQDLLNDVLDQAKKLGADGAMAVYKRGESLSVTARGREQEFNVERDTKRTIGIDVYVGQRKASTIVSTQKSADLRRAVEDVVKTAKNMPENKWAGLADPSELATDIPDLDMYDASRPSVEELTGQALAAEGLALLQPKVVHSEGGKAGWGESKSVIMATNGFNGSVIRSGSHIYASVIASDGRSSETGYDYTSVIHRSDMASALDIGEKAGHNAALKLGARQPQTGVYPVVFHPDIAAQLLGEFVSAASGGAVARKQTFLRNDMGKQIFNSAITICDDPHVKRGPGSRAFDGQGIATRPLTVVEKGVLKSWFLSLESARELGLKCTGHAGGVTNLFMQAGGVTPDELIADIKDGFYVMGLMGHGADTQTGDFSQGASGLWIKDGKLSYAVAEATVAGNLRDMFMRMIPANDLDRKESQVAAPTVRVDGLSIGGR